MLSSIANVFRAALLKPNLIYHFRLHFPITQVKIDSITQQLSSIKDSKNPKIALSLNAPRGPSSHYLILYEQFTRLRKQGIPIHCFLEDQVTTEGYMLACCADTIAANPFSIVGDIGSYTSYINIGNFLKKYGVKYENLGLGEDLFNKFNVPKRQKQAQKMVDSMEKLVVSRISERRGIPQSDVSDLKGKLFTAEQALSLKLVDSIGTYPEWRSGEHRKSEELPIGFSSFELDITKAEEDLFSKLLKLQSEDKKIISSFIKQNFVVEKVVELIVKYADDEGVMEFIDRNIIPMLIQ